MRLLTLAAFAALAACSGSGQPGGTDAAATGADAGGTSGTDAGTSIGPDRMILKYDGATCVVDLAQPLSQATMFEGYNRIAYLDTTPDNNLVYLEIVGPPSDRVQLSARVRPPFLEALPTSVDWTAQTSWARLAISNCKNIQLDLAERFQGGGLDDTTTTALKFDSITEVGTATTVRCESTGTDECKKHFVDAEVTLKMEALYGTKKLEIDLHGTLKNYEWVTRQ